MFMLQLCHHLFCLAQFLINAMLLLDCLMWLEIPVEVETLRPFTVITEKYTWKLSYYYFYFLSGDEKLHTCIQWRLFQARPYDSPISSLESQQNLPFFCTK